MRFKIIMDKQEPEVKVDSASDGAFDYEVGDSIRSSMKGGNKFDARDMTRMGKSQELRVCSSPWPTLLPLPY